MHIPVHNRDSLQTIFGNGMGSSDGHIVDEAESHGHVSFSVVAGGAHQCVGILNLVIARETFTQE